MLGMPFSVDCVVPSMLYAGPHSIIYYYYSLTIFLAADSVHIVSIDRFCNIQCVFFIFNFLISVPKKCSLWFVGHVYIHIYTF